VADEAKKHLRLADVEGRQRLGLEEARLVSVNVRLDLARILLEATSVRGQLLNRSFDNDREAHKAVRELGCKEIHDQDLVAAIAKNADSLAANTEWVWGCWQWLAEWVAKEPYGEGHTKRIECGSSLPVVPVNGGLAKAADLAGRIVTWRPVAAAGNLEDWLPLTFVEDWFGDRIQNEAQQDSPVRKLSKELGIAGPGADVFQRAVGRAIEQYWKDRQGDPGRFLHFILAQDWHETADASASLRRCPVPLARTVDGEVWAEAGSAYFGREWGNDLLDKLYDGATGIAWVATDGTPTARGGKWRRVLEWLGVAHCPRIQEGEQGCSVWQLPEGCDQWKQYLYTASDYRGRHVKRIAAVSRMDHLTVDNLDAAGGALLILLVSQHWEAYYRNRSKVKAEGSLSRERYRRSWEVDAKWWWEVRERLPMPRRGERGGHVALTKLWLPDKRTERALGGLVPVVDLDAFGDGKDAIRNWLASAVGLRERTEQLSAEEWKVLLSRRIPGKAPAERLVSEACLRDRVTGWYAACLETAAEQETTSGKAFASCPLLCRKGEVWQYVADEPRYLDDDNDLAAAFAEDLWLFHIRGSLAGDAVKYFGVLPLSQSVEVKVTTGEPQPPMSGDLNVRFSKSLPYVWAWRTTQSKQDAYGLSARLKGLKVLVVPVLKAMLSLGDVHHEVVRRWHVDDDTIYLHQDHTNQTELAQALAQALDLRSEADFYENLLRCSDDRQRKEKLLSKGIADAEIDRCLREYSGDPAVEEHPPDGPRQPANAGQGGSTSPTPSGGDDQEQQRNQPQAGQPDASSEGKPSESPASGKQPLPQEDPRTTSDVRGRPPGAGTGDSDEGGGTGGGGRFLTDSEKAELEEAGRDHAARELERTGFSVEKMPQANPGFDLRARKNGEELRVEVKAHRGRATVVDVTQREYREYLGQQGYRWELWNVEHLAENGASPVTITRYDAIPDDALDTRTFRVDLKQCQIKLQD